MSRPRLVLIGSVAALHVLVALACGGGDETTTTTTTSSGPDWSGSGTKADPYVADCNNYGKDLQGDVGDTFYVQCPADCTSGSVWGTGPYTRDSRICTAAIHAGAITTSGGLVKAGIAAGKDSYPEGEANGIEARSWGSYETSLTVEAGEEKSTTTSSGSTTTTTEDKKVTRPAKRAGKTGKRGR